MVAEQNTPANEIDSLPQSMTLGQIGMWIFISTEVMLFAGIVATYLVLRLTTMQTGWPTRSDMHVTMLTGIIMTLILVFSAVCAWNAWTASKEDRPRSARLWLLGAIGLGFAFLGIKSWEYYEKYEVGLMPLPGQRQIYEQADHQYLSSVNQRLRDSIVNLESKAQQPLSDHQSERLELLYSLKQDMAEATSRNAGRTTSPWHANLCMNLMAYQIYPHPDTGRNVEEVYVPERQRLGRDLDKSNERLFLVQQRQKLVAQQIVDLGNELKQFELLGGSDDESADFESKRNWLETKKKQEQDLEVESKRIQSTINPMQGRQDNLSDSFDRDGEFQGINERYDVRLPVVIPNGQAWMSAYLLLTGMHALHLITGLVALLCWLPQKLVSGKSAAFYVTCMYWQFVDAMWLAIFWLVYF